MKTGLALACFSIVRGSFTWVSRGSDEDTRVPVLPQDFGELVFFLLQLVLPSDDGSSPVIQTLDQSPLDLGWMVGVEVQLPVYVCWFSVDSDVQAAITSPLEQGVEKGSLPSFSTSTVNQMDGHTLFRWVRSSSTVPFFTMQQVSSTYLFQRWGFVGTVKQTSKGQRMWSVHILTRMSVIVTT